MSIPPLVCCTPPPPDQCEEDKYQEDFDISYNLSQDDDDEYSYGNFSSYHLQNNNLKRSNENVEISPSRESKDSLDISHDAHNDNNEEIISLHEGQIRTEKDNNDEELDLDISEESAHSCNKAESEAVISLSLDSSISDNIVENEVPADLRTLSPSPEINVNSIESTSFNEKAYLDDQVVKEMSNKLENASQSVTETLSCNNALEKDKDESSNSNVDDDFGDFDDFQFTVPNNKTSPIVDQPENPWDGPCSNENDDFGNFTANFDTIDPKTSNTDQISEPLQNEDNIQIALDDDDDFGDFDDFKSSAVEHSQDEEATCSGEEPYINLQLLQNESQFMESISNVLCSVFEEELSETDMEIAGKLESMLSETWGHLRETDIRQPYIVNWNNSNGQKTLLRALCIDSRNILFGPKWGYSMPKYAVNLSNAPLQPQKQQTPNSSHTEAPSTEKPTNKPGGWVDPFSSDGQESCNTESESVVEVTSSDLDVFEAVISSKPDKIYSSTLNVQPLRQINLPDTHIFTPTDSETPRSKTIHYDNVPPIILPQPTLENNQSGRNFNTQSIKQKQEEDDDWEFQEFKGMSASTSEVTSPQPKENIHPNSENVTKNSETYQIQVLEPIKMEPIMPSLNWPDPGEVKETFEEFSDFISKSTWDGEQPHITAPQQSKSSPEPVVENIETKLADLGSEPKVETPIASHVLNNVTVDDDFDTFQSAMPSKNEDSDIVLNNVRSNTPRNIPTQSMSQSPSMLQDFQYTFPKMNKSDSISFENTIRPTEALTHSLGFNPTELTPNTSSLGNISSDFLQPQPIISMAPMKTQKTTQILQPLSLEGYSQINWPNPGLDLQDLSRFNPVETLQSLKSDLSTASGSGGSSSKGASPVHAQKNTNSNNQISDEDIWGEFVSSKPKQSAVPRTAPVFADDDEWTDFVSSTSVKPQNGLNTISFNVHTNSNIQKNINNKFVSKNNKTPLDIPTLNYITPKSTGHNHYNERHFQNL